MNKHSILIASALLFALSASGQEAWDLRRCIDYAVSHNIQIKQAEKQIENQELTINTTRNNRLPGLDASASQNMSFGRGLTEDNTYVNRNTFSTSFGISANVQVFDGGQTTRSLRVQKLQLEALMSDLDRAKEDLSLQVASAYLEALFQGELVDVAKGQIALSRKQEERILILFKEGKATESQWAQAKSQVAADALQVTQAENSQQLALLNLSQLLELPTPEGFAVVKPEMPEPSTAELPLPDAIMAEALAYKPQFKAGESRVRSAEKNISLARTGYIPRISLGAGMGTNYYKTSGFDGKTFGRQMKDNFNRSIGLSLSIPVFDRFSTRNRIRTARVQYINQQLQLEQTHKDVYKQIQQAYYNATAAREQCAAAVAAEEAANVSFELMQTRYENGKATATEFEEAKTKLTRALSDKLRAHYQFYFRCKILEFYRGVAL